MISIGKDVLPSCNEGSDGAFTFRRNAGRQWQRPHVQVLVSYLPSIRLLISAKVDSQMSLEQFRSLADPFRNMIQEEQPHKNMDFQRTRRTETRSTHASPCKRIESGTTPHTTQDVPRVEPVPPAKRDSSGMPKPLVSARTVLQSVDDYLQMKQIGNGLNAMYNGVALPSKPAESIEKVWKSSTMTFPPNQVVFDYQVRNRFILLKFLLCKRNRKFSIPFA